MAPQGTYIYDQTGNVSTSGCLTSVQEVPEQIRLSVFGPQGDRQRILRDNLSPSPVESVLDLTLEYRPDGAYLVSMLQSQRFALQTVRFEFQADPPVRIVPAFPEPGQQLQFALTSADGRVNLDATVTVEALSEQVVLGNGSALAAHRIRTESRVTGFTPQGSLNVQIDRVTWYSPDNHLEIKDSTGLAGTIGLCRVDSDVESVARSL